MIFIKVLFVREEDKLNYLYKILNIFKTNGNEIIIQKIKKDKGIENENKNEKDKQIKRIVKKIKRKCINNNIESVVISKNLKNNKLFIDQIYENDVNIIDGKWLLTYMINEVLEFICNKKQNNKEEVEITILSKFISNESFDIVKQLSKEYKRINIVTKQINEFKHLENKIFDEYGMVMTVTNNKRKSLSKARIIINMDFSEKELNEFNIYENAIIINLKDNIKIKRKRFNGIVINDYEICSVRQDEYFDLFKIKNYYLKDLLEANIYRKKDSFLNIRRSITKGHFKIRDLYGINGKILTF